LAGLEKLKKQKELRKEELNLAFNLNFAITELKAIENIADQPAIKN
jgi:hypothetical protein